MMIALVFTALFAISGCLISEIVFAKQRFIIRIWLGLAIGLLLLTWLPSLFAFAVGFTLTAQILAAVSALLAGGGCALILAARRKKGKQSSYRIGKDLMILLWTIPILALCGALLHTHILYPHKDGSLWVGQVTYGDLAMHLGFITSIAEQSLFPPQYSIFPGHALNYPFLCETSGASLFQLGASVRSAYIISAGYAFVLVVFGVYLFFEQWLKRRPRAVFAALLFFFGGGFGFFYFFDLSRTGGLLSSLLHTHGETVSQTLLDGFYQTPTNIPALGLRWVNPIVDMLIPQRATLFGWAFLFPCMFLLHGFAFERKQENSIPLGVFAGLLPLIHTHSFLALGIVSAVYCVIDLISVRFEKKRLLGWSIYAVLACALAAPQLFLFTFRQTSESGLVRFHLNWANEADSYLWFYIKNLGWIFLLMPIAFLVMPKRDKKIYAGAIALWLIAELIEFQPNNYDNNKLLFIWFAFTCGITAKLIFVIGHRIMHALIRRSSEGERRHTYGIGIAGLTAAILLYCMFKTAFDSHAGFMMRPGTALTVFFAAALLLTMCIFAVYNTRTDRKRIVTYIIPLINSVWVLCSLFVLWLHQYRQATYSVKVLPVSITLVLSFLSLIVLALNRMNELSGGKPAKRFIGSAAALSIGFCLLLFSLFASSAMTVIRECKSEYQVYTKNETELSEQIKQATQPDDVILANSYHWNLVTPLTGRSIVTGTGTFLYYHGINTSEREADVALMYEAPADNLQLFAQYGVKYILISNAERGSYNIDYPYFEEHAEIVAKNEAGRLYRLKP